MYVFLTGGSLFYLVACRNYLDVVPDNVATLESAFATRQEAKKYLYTCYSYLPKNGDIDDDPGMVGGDELWRFSSYGGYFDLAQGYQNKVNVSGDRWQRYFRAIRDCNIFLDNIETVPDLQPMERRRWISEVTFLKAYYNFYLVKMYGPIPLIKENIPINADREQTRVWRSPVDSCFDYIVELINRAIPDLPLTIDDPASELGRITQVIAMSIKAKVLVYAASPLFNGNTSEAGLKNIDGTQLFNQTSLKSKWDSAVIACKKAIDICRSAGLELYYYHPDFQQFDLSDTIVTQLTIRNTICDRTNSETIWPNSQTNSTSLQQLITPRLDPSNLDIVAIHGQLSPPLKIAEMFYSNHGVPITEDKTWNYDSRYSLQKASDSDKIYVRANYTSAHLNFDREPRFYADLGFDGGIWYGQGRYDDKNFSNLFYVQSKYRQPLGFGKFGFGSVTGYFLKKLVHYQNVIGQGNEYSVTSYFFPIIRLSGLYLLYAEALNEAEGPGEEVYEYLNLVRERAGLRSVQSSWDTYSNNPTKYRTVDGLREIIHRERLIELAFEGQRFWDLRRWKEAEKELNMPVKGWDLMQEDASAYYRPKVVFEMRFGVRDYFWPIKESTIDNNRNLVQNVGW